MAKTKYKYGPEYPIQHYGEKMANEIGDSLSKFIEVLNREFTELRFKGIMFSDISIEFLSKGVGTPANWCRIEISCDLTGKIQTLYGEKSEDARMFVLQGRGAIEQVFGSIYLWRESLLKSHLAHIKIKEKEQGKLFKKEEL